MTRLTGTSLAERQSLRTALDGEDIVPLVLTLVHLSGDDGFLDGLQSLRLEGGSGDDDNHSAFREKVTERLLDSLDQVPRGDLKPQVDRALLERMVAVAVDVPLSEYYVSMLIDQAALPYRVPASAVGRPPSPSPVQEFRVVVIGSGVSGICAGVELKRNDIPFVILERNAEPGGTWFHNNYPGCGVDTPSFFYSYSFEQRSDWSNYFAKRGEILDYIQGCVAKYGLEDSIRYSSEVTSAVYDEARGIWTVRYRDASGTECEIEANAVITAVGQLNVPLVPNIEGLETFRGPAVHTADWDPAIETAGKRVALVGAGASAMQFGPAVAANAEKLTVFQRSPHWILPNPYYHRAVTPEQQKLFERIPVFAAWLRLQMIWSYGDAVFPALEKDETWPQPKLSLNATNERHRQRMIRHIREELEGRPDLVEKTIPSYPPYGKRVLLDNGWYKMLRREDVELVDKRIVRFTETGVMTDDDELHEVDVVAFATGFQASRMLSTLNIVGREGVVLRDVWGEDNPRAYLGITVPKFPNLFLLYGPNTNLGFGGSAIFHSECQVRYAVQCITALIANEWTSIECKQGVHDTYNHLVDETHAKMVWTCDNVNNWYRNKAGRVTTNSPWRLGDYWRMTRAPDFNDFIVADRPVQQKGRVQWKSVAM